MPGFPKGWREEIKAGLAGQVEAGGTLYGVRSDGACIARTSEGERVLGPIRAEACLTPSASAVMPTLVVSAIRRKSRSTRVELRLSGATLLAQSVSI